MQPLAALALCAMACTTGGVTDALPDVGPFGHVRVTVTSTGGDLDADGYTVAIDGESPRTLPGNVANHVESFFVPSGAHGVTLGNVAANCTLSGESSRTVTVAGEASRR